MKNCPRCGKRISEFSLTCPFCSCDVSTLKQGSNEAAEQHKTKVIVKSNKETLDIVVTATVCAIVAHLIWRWITAQFYGFFGETVQSAFIAVSLSAVIRNIIFLILGGVALFVAIKAVKRTRVLAIAIISVFFALVQFLVICNVKAYNYDMAIFLYTPYLFRMLALVCGVGAPILQGTLCVVSMRGSRKRNIQNTVVISAIYLTLATLGAFVGIWVLEQGIMGGIWAICGTFAAVVATIMISVRQQ